MNEFLKFELDFIVSAEMFNYIHRFDRISSQER